MSSILIGRQSEISLLSNALSSKSPELVAVYGRRRVGKTFLISMVLEKNIVFECTGIHGTSTVRQLENFSRSMYPSLKSDAIKVPKDWFAAFEQLAGILKPKIRNSRKVIFLDEFPWFENHKSGFLNAFAHFWNSWASKQPNLMVVICGSAASWMIKNVVNNKGGLHNRLTLRIKLLPFSLRETEDFLRHKHINLDRYQVLQLYMVMGGIPQYLNEVRKGESASQAIDRICFTKDGFLAGEFKNLYPALFTNAANHLIIIRALAGKIKGLSRQEIITTSGIKSGGRISATLSELEESGFISSYVPYGNEVKESLFRLTDEFSLFHLRFIDHPAGHAGRGTWNTINREKAWEIWSGYAFEGICIKHIEQIKKGLGIAGVYSQEASWRYKGDKQNAGTQIDLLIDRQDHCINICEVKFSSGLFIISKKYNYELMNKIEVFRQQSRTRKSIFLTMLTTFGVSDNKYKIQSVHNELTMNDLFV